MATSRAPASLEDLERLLHGDIKVKVAGTRFVDLEVIKYHLILSICLGIDGEQTIGLLQILCLLNLASSGWRSSRKNYGVLRSSACLHPITFNQF